MRRSASPWRSRNATNTCSDLSSELSATTCSSSGTGHRRRWLAGAVRSCFSSPDLSPPRLTSLASPNASSSSPLRRIFQEKPSSKEPGIRNFTMAEIQRATKSFSPNLKIGQGGSGTVYKGRLDNGTLVAVKCAKKTLYDKHTSLEFQNEAKTLQCMEHMNLVELLGYLEHEDEKIIIVEYVPNGNLREHLDCLGKKLLDFSARLDIAIDVAHAITYLHSYADNPVIHRDIKSSNILLMDNLRAKVADFGFAKLVPTDVEVTHISTQVRGTAGYLDPEYLRTYQISEKSDVYSFGVLLVELVTGRRPIEPKRPMDERLTAKWAIAKFLKGHAVKILDPNLPHNQATNLAVEKIFELSFQCLAPMRNSRPNMRWCAEILWNIRRDYRENMP